MDNKLKMNLTTYLQTLELFKKIPMQKWKVLDKDTLFTARDVVGRLDVTISKMNSYNVFGCKYLFYIWVRPGTSHSASNVIVQIEKPFWVFTKEQRTKRDVFIYLDALVSSLSKEASKTIDEKITNIINIVFPGSELQEDK